LNCGTHYTLGYTPSTPPKTLLHGDTKRQHIRLLTPKPKALPEQRARSHHGQSTADQLYRLAPDDHHAKTLHREISTDPEPRQLLE
jgi:hypothetical protein